MILDLISLSVASLQALHVITQGEPAGGSLKWDYSPAHHPTYTVYTTRYNQYLSSKNSINSGWKKDVWDIETCEDFKKV